MPKIKLKAHGFEKLTGLVGSIEFVDGVSVETVSNRDATRLGALMRVEDADTGEELNIAKDIETRLRAEPKTRPDPVKADSEGEGEGDKPELKQADKQADKTPEPKTEQGELRVYSEAELAEIADRDGIAGLREIAKALDVSDNSIKGLIAKILQAQKA